MADQTVQGKFSAMGGGEIQLGVTRKPVTAWGGLALFAAFGEAVGLREQLERALSVLGRTSPNALPAPDLMLGFVAGVLTGASRFLHLERMRADAPVRAMFGIRRFCAPSTYTRFFQSFTRQGREEVFSGLTRWGLGLLPGRDEGYTLDMDSTVLERWGEQEGALRGYNPRRHGRATHHPLLAGLAEAKWVLHGWLRGGNAASANNATAFLTECLALAEGLVRVALVRADSGFFDNRFLTFMEERALPYLVKARMTKQVKLAMAGVREWVRVGRGIEVAEASIRLMGWAKTRRLVVIRQEEAEKDTALGKPLFDIKGYKDQGVVTSAPVGAMDATTVYRRYNGRADFENRIKELKLGCGMEGFCMDSFVATECVLRTLCLIHNLVQHFQDRIGLRPAAAPRQEGPRYMMETLRYRLFSCAAVLGRRARTKVLRLSASPPWLDAFHRALARLLPPPSNCKAERPTHPLLPLTD